MPEPVVVTGIGLITPLGCSREKTWHYVRAGQSIVPVKNAESFPKEFEPYLRTAPFVNPKGAHRIFPIAMSAAHEALEHARLDLNDFASEAVGCSVSVSKPIFDQEPFSQRPADSVGRYLAEKLKISGPVQNVVAACATGIHSILMASRWLQEGLCDVAIAGSAESSLHPFVACGFKNLGVLSEAPRPFDKRRQGFMMGEGAGVLVLERKSQAEERGAKGLAEIAGCSVGSDHAHPTRFAEDGSSIASVISRGLKDSGLTEPEIDYVNLHGTGTELNDLVETRGIKKAFGAAAYKIPMSSTKASTGHLLGAAASVEAGLACLALRDQFIPPTAGLEEPAAECDLDYTPRRGKHMVLRNVLSLSFGFGGPIGAVIFKRP